MTHLKQVFSLLFVLAFAQALAQAPPPPTETEACTADDYAIYAAALGDRFGKQKPKRVVLLDQTSMGFPPGMAAMTQFGGKAQTLLKDVPREAKDDFDTRNKARAKIEGGEIKAAFEVILLSAEEAGKLVAGGGGWEGFYNKYPNSGITLVSRPGINAEHNRALLYMGTSCGGLCGDGVLLLLGKDGEEWKVLNRVTIWVS
jgi:hypothetical protein